MIEKSPAQWGAKVDYDSWNDRPVPKDKIVVHYNGPELDDAFDGPEAETEILRGWEQFHLAKKWRGVAYGWVIGMSGIVYRARGWNLYGAHTGDVDADGINENDEGIPVAFMIGEHQEPTAKAIVAFRELRAVLQADDRTKYSIVPLYGHRDISDTACPGDPLYALVKSNFGGIPQEASMTPEDIQAVAKETARQVWQGSKLGASSGGISMATAIQRTYTAAMAIHEELENPNELAAQIADALPPGIAEYLAAELARRLAE